MSIRRPLLPKGGVARNLVRLFFLFGIIPLGILALTFFGFYFREKRLAIGELQQEVAERIATGISGHLERTKGKIELFARFYDLMSMDAQRLRNISYDMLDQELDYNVLTISDIQGNEVCKVSRYYTFRTNELRNLAHEGRLSPEFPKQTKISKIEISAFNKLPEIHITVPIYDWKEQVAGLLDVSVNVARMWELISKYRIGKDRYAYVVDPQGTLLAYQDVSSVLGKTDLKGIEIVQALLRGETGVFEYVGFQGSRVIGANALIPSTGWGIVVEEPLNEAYRTLYALSAVFLSIFLLTVLVALVLGLRFSFRSLVRPLQSLQEQAAAFAHGNFDHRINMTRSDELGQLSETFNKMAADLQKTTVSRDLLVKEIEQRKLTEEELQKLASVVRHSKELVNLATIDGKMIFLNDAGIEMLGIASEEIKQASIMQVIPDHLQEKVQTELMPALIKDGWWRGELQYRNLKTGKLTEVHAETFTITDPSTGVPLLLANVSLDITEHKRAEDALRESEATLKSIFRVAPIGIGLVSDRVLRQVNDRLCGIIGYSREELVGESARILYPSQEEFEWVGRVKYAQISQRGTGTVETHWQKKDGEVINVLLSSTPLDPIDLTAGVTFTALDISERKRAAEALNESQERFRELAELLPETIFEMDTSGNLTFVNRNAFDHFGYSQEDFEHGMNGFELVSPEDRPRALENAKRVMSGEKIGLSEYRVLRKDGTTFPAIMHSAAKFLDGMPVGLRGIVIDITETKKLESQLHQARKMEAIGTLAGGIAHDFNNLLQAVQGYAELLLLRKTEEESGYKELLEISRAAKRGGDLTRQLLTFSRKVESKLQPVDLNRTVNDVKMLLERTIPKMIKVELRLMGNLHSVNADASQVEQVMMNLAVNARDAMPEGGTLTIETKNVILDEEDCCSQPELTPGNYVLLTVSDTGQGMDKTTLEHIFDPFFTTKEVGKGTGLGLAMVYGIVKSHQADITCISNPGEGTAFKIHFPAIEQLKESPSDVAGAAISPGGTETILLVDDDDSVRDLGEETLQMFGYAVISAPDGESAMQIYREGKDRIDLVILDLIMPGMGGMQCLQRLLEMNPQAKVVIASGYSVKGETERAAKSGAKAFINKPYNVQQMLKVVREVLD